MECFLHEISELNVCFTLTVLTDEDDSASLVCHSLKPLFPDLSLLYSIAPNCTLLKQRILFQQ